MSYQVIARKWRPQSFDQLIGQKHISQTLQNALKNNRLPHALLFTGPRGTGKTSSARILAKSLRCSNAVDFEPCNQCPSCLDINLSRAVDVIEIDGASNNGVDAIRELRDTVGYMPSSGKYKVYIIDEVHMLSTSAFNALLKTLEEPPEHVVFIMATTEAHKIPQTILSRCQRFDFRSISTRQITDQLKEITLKEGVAADEESLWMIARQGDGSMRDSFSLLDQVITFANGPLTKDNVIQILGLTDRALLLETLTALTQRNTTQILEILEKIHLAGYEASLYSRDLLENIRNLLFIKISGRGETPRSVDSMLELPDSEMRFLHSLAVDLSEEDIHLLFDMALKGAADISRATDPKLVLEMMLLRMSQAPRIVDLATLMKGGSFSATAKTAASSPAKMNSQENSAPPKKENHQVSAMGLNPQDQWLQFVQKIRSSDALFAAKIESLLFLGKKDKTLDLAIPAKLSFLKDQLADSSVRSKLQELLQAHFGVGTNFQIQVTKNETVGTSAQAMAQQKQKVKQDELAQKVAEHPMIKSATTAFKGQIKSIKSQQTS